MTDRRKDGIEPVLRERWRCWTEIVRLFALRKGTRYDIDRDDYHALHQELLNLCRQKSSRAEVGELTTIITPWVTLDSLGWADPDVIHQLLHRAELVQAQLDGGVNRRHNRKRLRLSAVYLGMSVIGITGLILLCRMERIRWNGLFALGQTVKDIGAVIDRWGINQPILLGGTIVMILAVLLVWLSGRRN